ncbi:MAG: J domain-containing protein [Sphingobacteriales bacterium]|nr:J domain-containing protein [Sphingobacteriales bacterium]
MKDYYSVLGVKNDASLEEIKKAYRKLSMVFHPDKTNGDEFYTERFKDIQEAYETLTDYEKRLQYDNRRKTKESTSKQNTQNNFLPLIEIF